MKTVIAIPALDEAATVADVVARALEASAALGDVTVLVVDDGSSDDTAALARQAGATVISHGRNRGLGVAFATARRHALETGVDVLVTIDADGQFPADRIPDLAAPVVEGRADLVTASRFLDPALAPHGIPWIKRWGNGVVARLIGILAGQHFTDVSCGFRAYSREALARLNLFGAFTYTHETFLAIANHGLAIDEVPVRVVYPPDRRSRMAWSIPRYAWRTLGIICRTFLDQRPLTVFSLMAAAILLVAGALALVPAVHWLQTGSLTPYKAFGFAGGFLAAIAALVACIGLVADILTRVRLTQERVLAELRLTARHRD